MPREHSFDFVTEMKKGDRKTGGGIPERQVGRQALGSTRWEGRQTGHGQSGGNEIDGTEADEQATGVRDRGAVSRRQVSGRQASR